MNVLELEGRTKKSTILLGESIDNILTYTRNRKLFIITDKNINRIYGSRFPEGRVFSIGMGEGIKTYETVNAIYAELLDHGFDRSSFILGIGGGVVCDIAGFAASTYMRGIEFGFVPTTLLAQVDASIGGKNGVNFGEYKNMVGTFNQPEFILTDFSLLKTLDPEEFKNGIAESIKHALIGDPELAQMLLSKSREILNYDLSIIESMVNRSVNVKLDIVKRDEIEKNERKKLNFGHTIGHAVELSEGLSHGKSVSIGIVIASLISLKYDYIDKKLYEMIIELLTIYGLPIEFNTPVVKLVDKIWKDKKKQNNEVDFVLLKSLGNSLIEKISFKKLEEMLNDLR